MLLHAEYAGVSDGGANPLLPVKLRLRPTSSLFTRRFEAQLHWEPVSVTVDGLLVGAWNNGRMAKVIAIIGASSNRHKFGNKALRAFRDEGYTVLPINPNEAEVEGIKTYPSVLDVPHAIDMATVYVPPDIGQGLLAEFEKKQIAEIWLNPGAESDSLIRHAKSLHIEPIVACSIVAIGQDPYKL